MLYLAADPALSVLEVRVHLDVPPALLPDDFVLVAVDVTGLAAEDRADMPDDPGAFGDAWLREARSALLRVPSAIVAESANILLNPSHEAARRAKVIASRPFAFDRRLWLPG